MQRLWIHMGWWAIVLLALLAIYLPALQNTPVFDDRLLTSGDLFSAYGPLATLKPRLLSYGSFVWIQEIFGPGWWKQRLVNLLIHAGVVVALWGFYRQVAKAIVSPTQDDGSVGQPYQTSPALALAIGAFAINPVAVYAVAYLVQRSILMATLFAVLALWSFARGLGENRVGWFVFSVVCYLLAVLSKEHVVMLPMAAIPVFIVVARPAPRKLAVLAVFSALLVAVIAGLLLLNYGEIIGQPFDEHSRVYLRQLAALGPEVERNAFGLSIANQSYFFFKYGFHWLLPYAGWMSIDLRPPFPITFWSVPQLLGLAGYVLVVIGGFVLVVRYRDGRALAGLSLLLPALLFVTEFSTVWVQDPFVLYRSYLWAIGIPGLILLLFHDLSARAVLITGLVLGALLTWQGVDRSLSLATPEKVWNDAVAKLPDDPRAVGRWFPHLNLAEAYLDQNKLNEAYRHFKASSALGDQGLGLYNMGAMLGMVGKYAESLKALDDAKRQGYDGFGVDYQRGVALFGKREFKLAYDAFLAAEGKTPPANMAGRIAMALGRTAKAMGAPLLAIRHFQRASALSQGDPAAQIELGSLYVASGDFQAAHDLFTTLIRESPTGPAFLGRALANHGLKRKADATSDIDAAIRIGPDNPGLREWQAKIRAMP